MLAISIHILGWATPWLVSLPYYRIFSFLDVVSLCRCAQVSKVRVDEPRRRICVLVCDIAHPTTYLSYLPHTNSPDPPAMSDMFAVPSPIFSYSPPPNTAMAWLSPPWQQLATCGPVWVSDCDWRDCGGGDVRTLWRVPPDTQPQKLWKCGRCRSPVSLIFLSLYFVLPPTLSCPSLPSKFV